MDSANLQAIVAVPPLSTAAIQPNGKPLGRRFQPGQSGNPGGKPAIIRHIRDIAREYTEAAIQTLAAIMVDAKASPAARVAAAGELLDRAWGRPVNFNAD